MRIHINSGLFGIAAALALTTLTLSHNIVHTQAQNQAQCTLKYTKQRYQTLKPAIQKIVKKIFGYSPKQWNHMCVANPMEDVRYSRLTEDAMTQWGNFKGLNETVITKELAKMGFPDANCWDHFTKYKGYTWKEMKTEQTIKGEKLYQQAKALGWTRESWHGKAPNPVAACYSWKKLNRKQKKGARNLGWNNRSWRAHICGPQCSVQTTSPTMNPTVSPTEPPTGGGSTSVSPTNPPFAPRTVSPTEPPTGGGSTSVSPTNPPFAPRTESPTNPPFVGRTNPPTGGDRRTSAPTGEGRRTNAPTGDRRTSDPTGDRRTSDPTGGGRTSAPTGEGRRTNAPTGEGRTNPLTGGGRTSAPTGGGRTRPPRA